MPRPAPTDPSAAPIDDTIAAFLGGRRSIIAASHNAANRTSLMRAVGARLSADRREVTVLLTRSQSAQLLDDLRAQGTIAVVFSEPTTHRTLQLKGCDARVDAATPEDLALLVPYADSLAAELAAVGIEPRFARAMIAADAEDVLAVRFTPTEIYDQTPGPRAGAAL